MERGRRDEKTTQGSTFSLGRQSDSKEIEEGNNCREQKRKGNVKRKGE